MVLYEAAVAIPVIAMLAMTAVTVFAWGMKTYFVQLADGEFRQWGVHNKIYSACEC